MDVTTNDIEKAELLHTSRHYELRLRIEYKSGDALDLEASTPEDMAFLVNMGRKVLYPNSRDAVSLAEMNSWLGWST